MLIQLVREVNSILISESYTINTINRNLNILEKLSKIYNVNLIYPKIFMWCKNKKLLFKLMSYKLVKGS